MRYDLKSQWMPSARPPTMRFSCEFEIPQVQNIMRDKNGKGLHWTISRAYVDLEKVQDEW